MFVDKNLVEMSLRLKKLEPIFRTIRELPGIVRRPPTRDNIRLVNLPTDFMLVRQKPDQTIIFRILLAVNLNFPLLTNFLKKNLQQALMALNLKTVQ